MPYQIPSTEIWRNTGFNIPASKNDKTVTIIVNAASKWTANSHAGGGGTYDARGWIGKKPGGGGYKMPTSDEGCLVGKIDGTAFMFSFDAGKVKIPGDGKIYLAFNIDGQLNGNVSFGINDNDGGIGDNGGEMQVLEINLIENVRP